MPYFVENKVSITGRKRKIFDAHDEVTAEDLGHSDGKGLKQLEAKGKVYSAKVSKPAEEAAKREAAAKSAAADADKPAAAKKKPAAGGAKKKEAETTPPATPPAAA